MAQRFLRDPVVKGVRPPVIGKNSEVLKVGTPVTIDSSGFIAGCTSSAEKVYGYSLEDKTMTSDNQTVAGYCPLIIDPVGILIAITSATLAQTDVGEYGDIATNTAGAIVMANPSTAGQFLLEGINPDDATEGYWSVAEPQQSAAAQA